MKSLTSKILSRCVSVCVAVVFCFTSVITPGTAAAQSLPLTMADLPVPGTMVVTTAQYQPLMIKGIRVHPENPLKFNFIMDTGDSEITGAALRSEANRLVKYFLASLTMPENEMWVNLSPYETNRIITESFGRTEMGRDLLAQDYILKQLT
ncbi:MAG: hypothetical protein K8I00_13310, partial [Candidatus Omnitrophica bacterium]|nr:hypothetical protein [Candidatus Omnitrophota bacterium]